MQQKIARLTVENPVEANETLSELRKLDPTIAFRCVTSPLNVTLCSFSDAAHPKDRDYRQTGFFTGILRLDVKDGNDVFHMVDGSSHKQQWFSHSAYSAEIFATATADGCEFYFKTAINILFPSTLLKHELNVDSNALWDTITTLHEGREYRLQQTV